MDQEQPQKTPAESSNNIPIKQATKQSKPRKVRKPTLTPKQRKFVKGIIAGKGKGEAAVAAGYSPNTASSIACNQLKNVQIRKAIESVWDKCGLTDDYIGNKVKDLTKATKVQYFAKDGVVCDERVTEDTAVQRSSIELAARLKGLLVDRSVSLNVSIDISPVDLSRYRKDKPIDI
jgi:hypothetical protein